MSALIFKIEKGERGEMKTKIEGENKLDCAFDETKGVIYVGSITL